MKVLNIDPEFKNLIDPLSPDELSLLEESLKKEGCRDSLVTWQGTLVDGHNRYKICRENNIQFSVVEKEFKDRNEAVIWIIKNQLGRRNTTPASRIKYALRLEDEIKKQARENSGKRTDLGQLIAPGQSGKTNKILGEISRTNEESVRIYKKVQKEGDEELKKDLDSGKITINKANKLLKEQAVDKGEKKVDELKRCPLCGKEKHISEFGLKKNQCKSCCASVQSLGMTMKEATKIGMQDHELDQFIEQMKNPSSQESDNGLNGKSISPIITELQEVLNTVRININKFTFMAEAEGNSEIKKTIESIIKDLSKINSNIKEK